MIPEFVNGAIAPVFTAFNQDGSLDDKGQRAILDYLVSTESVSAYFVRCGLGQLFVFDEADTRQIAKNCCEHMDGKGPVLVGCMGIWDRNRDRMPDPAVYQKQAVELSKYAEGVGAAAVVHTMPEAMMPRPGQTPAEVVIEYFEQLSAAVTVPIFIYQTPGTDERYCINEELAIRLAQIPHVAGMKLSCSDAAYIFDIVHATRDRDFGFIVGAETAFLAGLLFGARACIGQGATVNPAIIKAIQTRYNAGDLEGAMEAQYVTNLLVYKSNNCVEFFKRWIAEKGYGVQPYARSAGGNPYMQDRPPVSQEEYEAYKKLLEFHLAQYM